MNAIVGILTLAVILGAFFIAIIVAAVGMMLLVSIGIMIIIVALIASGVHEILRGDLCGVGMIILAVGFLAILSSMNKKPRRRML